MHGNSCCLAECMKVARSHAESAGAFLVCDGSCGESRMMAAEHDPGLMI